jgi:hypothetical protein
MIMISRELQPPLATVLRALGSPGELPPAVASAAHILAAEQLTAEAEACARARCSARSSSRAATWAACCASYRSRAACASPEWSGEHETLHRPAGGWSCRARPGGLRRHVQPVRPGRAARGHQRAVCGQRQPDRASSPAPAPSSPGGGCGTRSRVRCRAVGARLPPGPAARGAPVHDGPRHRDRGALGAGRRSAHPPGHPAALVNSANDQGQGGDLLLGEICQGTVSQADAEAACRGVPHNLTIPAPGDRVTVTGSYVLDANHGWMEIHPVTRLTVTGHGGAAPPPQPSASGQPAGGSCHPTTPSGNCYERGEFCSAAEHGESGVAGDGEAITCKQDGSYWRWS